MGMGTGFECSRDQEPGLRSKSIRRDPGDVVGYVNGVAEW